MGIDKDLIIVLTCLFLLGVVLLIAVGRMLFVHFIAEAAAKQESQGAHWLHHNQNGKT